MNFLKLNLAQHWPKYLIVLIVSLFFLQSVKQRAPYFGKYTTGDHNWLTAHSVLFLREWIDEGALNNKFVGLWQPNSIERTSMADRLLYVSYPPGNLLPLFVFCKTTGQYPSKDIVMAYNLTNHFLIAIVLAFIAYNLTRILELGRANRVLLSLIAPAFYLFSPSIMYWHQNVFFTDQGIILPFILLIALESFRPILKMEGMWKYFYAFVVFWGCSIDWLMFVLLASIYLWRALTTKEFGIKKHLDIVLPSTLLLVLFVIQLWLVGGFEVLIQKFFGRTGAVALANESLSNRTIGTMSEYFWNGHMKSQYGESWFWLLIIAAATAVLFYRWCVINKNGDFKSHAIASFLLLTSCFVQVYALSNHSQVHSFSTLKFGLVFAIIPFTLTPILLVYFVNKMKFSWAAPVACILVSIYCFAHILNENGRKCLFFGDRSIGYSHEQDDELTMHIAESIREVSKFDYLLFSPNLHISFIPPCSMSESMKQCYPLEKVGDFAQYLSNNQAKLCLLFTSDNLPKGNYLNFLTEKSLKIWENANFKMFCFYGVESEKILSEHRKFVENELMRISQEDTAVLNLMSFYEQNKTFVPVNFNLNEYCRSMLSRTQEKIRPFNESVHLVSYKLEKQGAKRDSLYKFKMCIQVVKRIPDNQKLDWLIGFSTADKNDNSKLGPMSSENGFLLHSLNEINTVKEEGFCYAEKDILIPNAPLYFETHIWETVAQQPFGETIQLNPHQFPMKYKL